MKKDEVKILKALEPNDGLGTDVEEGPFSA